MWKKHYQITVVTMHILFTFLTLMGVFPQGMRLAMDFKYIFNAISFPFIDILLSFRIRNGC